MLRRAVFSGLVLLLLAGLAWRQRACFGTGNAEDTSYGDEGRALRFGIPADLNHLPLSILAADLFEPGEARGPRAARAAAVACVAVLTASLGGLLAGLAGAAAASVVMLAAAPAWAGFSHPQTGFSILVLMAACLLVLFRRRPSWGTALLLALGLGACLLYRSAMAFFPAAFGLVMAATRAGRTLGRGRLAVLAVAPALFLLPWVWVQRDAGRGISLFEWRQAQSNFAAASLGMPFCIEGDWRSLLPSPGPGRDWQDDVWLWGGSEMIRHPLRTVRAAAVRSVYVLGLHPWLFVLAGVGLWLGRRRPEVAALGLLAAYLMVVHVALAVKEDYFRPLWPLLAGLASAGLAGLGRVPSRGPSSSWAWPALAALVVAVAASGWSGALLIRHGVRSGALSEVEVVSAALEEGTGDPWLWAKAGEARLAAGDVAGASSAFARASSLRPGQRHWALRRAWLKALSGDDGDLDAMTLDAGEAGLEARLDEQLLKAHAALRRGRPGLMRERLDEALRLQDSDGAMATVPGKALPSGVLERLQEGARGLLHRIQANLGGVPAGERLSLVETLSELRPSHCGYLLQGSELAAEAGLKPKALDLLAKARSRCRGEEDSRRAAAVYRGLGEAERALALLEAEVKRGGGTADAWVEYAQAAAASGRTPRALEALAQVEALSPGPDAARRAASLYRLLGEDRRALRLCGASLKAHPGQPGLWLEDAMAAVSTGDRVRAMRDLDRVLGLRRSDEDIAAAAAVFRALGDHGRAMRLLGGLAGRPSSLPAWRLSYAEAAAAAGERRAALAAVGEAARTPGSGEDLRRAAAVYQALGEYGSCGRILKGLVRVRPRDPGLRSDFGVCLWLGGSRSEAASQLDEALRLDPGFLPAVSTRGSMLASEGRSGEARRLYDAALSRPSPARWSGLRSGIESARRSLSEPR
ncbi:MAG: tetratricopeptide repeat protein [Elusimicrobiota bacterium]|jgi:tetratricopeptide (TPR) repeat protein